VADVKSGQFPNNETEAFAFPEKDWLELAANWALSET
jgi:hypothetical protein